MLVSIRPYLCLDSPLVDSTTFTVLTSPMDDRERWSIKGDDSSEKRRQCNAAGRMHAALRWPWSHSVRWKQRSTVTDYHYITDTHPRDQCALCSSVWGNENKNLMGYNIIKLQAAVVLPLRICSGHTLLQW